MAQALCCGTLAEGDGGGENLPDRGIVPFTPLTPEDHDSVPSLPFILSHEAMDLDEPSAIASSAGIDLYVQASQDDTSQILRASSADGIAFGPLESMLLPELDWEEGWVGAPSVAVEDGRIHLWYRGGTTRQAMGLAVSDDGVSWSRASEPVLRANEGERIDSPSVVRWQDRWLMFYSRAVDRSEEPLPSVIARAESLDGLVFERLGTALGRGLDCVNDQGSPIRCWDSVYVAAPGTRVVVSPAGRPQLDLWYSGGNGGNSDIGFAGSTDTAAYSRYRLNPVLASDSAERAASVIQFQGRTFMYHAVLTQGRWRIALAWDRL